jgi:hypothetical protein
MQGKGGGKTEAAILRGATHVGGRPCSDVEAYRSTNLHYYSHSDQGLAAMDWSPPGHELTWWKVQAVMFLPLPIALIGVLSTPAPRNVRRQVLWFTERVRRHRRCVTPLPASCLTLVSHLKAM